MDRTQDYSYDEERDNEGESPFRAETFSAIQADRALHEQPHALPTQDSAAGPFQTSQATYHARGPQSVYSQSTFAPLPPGQIASTLNTLPYSSYGNNNYHLLANFHHGSAAPPMQARILTYGIDANNPIPSTEQNEQQSRNIAPVNSLLASPIPLHDNTTAMAREKRVPQPSAPRGSLRGGLQLEWGLPRPRPRVNSTPNTEHERDPGQLRQSGRQSLARSAGSHSVTAGPSRRVPAGQPSASSSVVLGNIIVSQTNVSQTSNVETVRQQCADGSLTSRQATISSGQSYPLVRPGSSLPPQASGKDYGSNVIRRISDGKIISRDHGQPRFPLSRSHSPLPLRLSPSRSPGQPEAEYFGTEKLTKIAQQAASNMPQSTQAIPERAGNANNSAQVDVQTEPARKRRKRQDKAPRYNSAILKDKTAFPALVPRPWQYGLTTPPAFTNSRDVEVVDYHMKRENGGRPRKGVTNESADQIANRNLNMEIKRASRDRDAAVKGLDEARQMVLDTMTSHGTHRFNSWLRAQSASQPSFVPASQVGCYVDDRNAAAMMAAGIASGQYSSRPDGSAVQLSSVADSNGRPQFGGYLTAPLPTYMSPFDHDRAAAATAEKDDEAGEEDEEIEQEEESR